MERGLELVRVRVLFLEVGDKVHPSYLDNCITNVSLQDRNRLFDSSDYEADGYFKLSVTDFVDSVELHSYGASPNDPVVEMLKPLVAVYFDPLECNADWDSGAGQIGWMVSETSLMDVFGDEAEKLIYYARALRQRAKSHKSEWGTRVQFLTMWSCWTSKSYFGEWDNGEDLLGIFEYTEAAITKIDDAIQRLKNQAKVPEIGPLD